MSDTPVVVVGAGVVGCAVARALAPDHDVRVLERDAVGSGATNRGAGEVTMTPSYTDYPAVATHANEFFRAYDGTGDFWFTDRESLELVPFDRVGEARRRVERLRRDGVDVTFLEAATVDREYPRLDLADYAGAVQHADTGFTDPPTLVRQLATDARARGATIQTGITVTDLDVQDGAVAGVETTAGHVPASHVVAAAGWRTRDLVADHVQLPVRPYRTQCAVFQPDRPLPDDFPMGWVPGEHVYFRPTRDGDVLAGGWSRAEPDPDNASRESDDDFRTHARDVLRTFLDDAGDLSRVDDWAGVDAATPDTRPLIDAPADAPTGLVVATGFHGRGIMTAPVAATAVRTLLTDETAPFPLTPFRLDRFDDRSPDFRFTSISDGDY